MEGAVTPPKEEVIENWFVEVVESLLPFIFEYTSIGIISSSFKNILELKTLADVPTAVWPINCLTVSTLYVALFKASYVITTSPLKKCMGSLTVVILTDFKLPVEKPGTIVEEERYLK